MEELATTVYWMRDWRASSSSDLTVVCGTAAEAAAPDDRDSQPAAHRRGLHPTLVVQC